MKPLKYYAIVNVIFIGFGLSLSTLSHSKEKKALIVPIANKDNIAVAAQLAADIRNELNQKHYQANLYYPWPQQAPAHSSKAARLMKEAYTKFQMLEFSAVRKLARKAMAIYKAQLKLGSSSSDYVNALHLLAAAEHFDGNEKEAIKRMNDAIIWDKRPPIKRRFNPNVQALHKKVLENKHYQGTIEFDVQPSALLWLNHKFVGASTGKIPIRAGLYLFQIALPGYSTYRVYLRVQPQKTRLIKLELKKGKSVAPSLIATFRGLKGQPPKTLLELSKRHNTPNIILVDADHCSTQCIVNIKWATPKEWKIQATLKHDPKSPKDTIGTALAFLYPNRPTLIPSLTQNSSQIPLSGQCMLDSQCPTGQSCKSGICKSEGSSIFKKWWFWTIVGVGVAGAATAIIVPLASPDNPVIEVK